jgi:hypothetical protein
MKHGIQTFTISAIAAIGITGCEISFEPPDSHSVGATMASTSTPSMADVALCEQITRKIISQNQNSFYTPQFAELLRKGMESDGSEAPYLNYDFIMETQDMEPKALSLGPGKIIGNKIYVPYVQVHEGSKPFTKTWVFVNSNGQWLAEDLLTSGLERGNGSMFKELSEL